MLEYADQYLPGIGDNGLVPDLHATGAEFSSSVESGAHGPHDLPNRLLFGGGIHQLLPPLGPPTPEPVLVDPPAFLEAAQVSVHHRPRMAHAMDVNRVRK